MSELAVKPSGVNLSCPDWFEKMQRGELPIANLALNDNHADRAASIFDKLVLPDVPGQPTMAEAAGQWIKETIRNIFGTVKVDGKRDIREFMILVPKKNAKTTNGAGIMVTVLLMNKRPRAEFLLIGPTQEIADTAFSQAVGMIEGDPEGYLQKRFKIVEHKKIIIDMNPEGPGYKSKLRIKTFDTKILTGAKPVGVLVDELHVLGKNKDASKVMKQLRGGIIANDEGFLIFITTQSDEPPTGIFKTELDYARRIRDGEIIGDMLPILFEFPVAMQADEKQPWKDVANWHLVLPNLNKSITLDRLIGEYEKAVNKGVEELSEWASQHLNIQIGIALSKDRWRGVQYWLGAADKTITLKKLMRRCEVLVVGVDGGGLDDMFGLTVMGREKRVDDDADDQNNQRWLAWSKAWIHPDAYDERPENQEKYNQFKKEGDLVICEYPNQDAIEAAALCAEIRDAGLLPEKYGIGVDAVGISDFIDELQFHDFEDEEITTVAQGYRLSGSINGAERRLKAKTFIHDGSNMMTWCVGNCKAEVKGSAVLVTKQVSGRAKIDPVISLFNAFALMSRHPEAKRKISVYAKQKVLVV